jgi:Zn-dependent protease
MYSSFTRGEPEAALAALVSALILLLICFPIHELAHAAVAYRLGDNTAQREGRITLNPLAHLDPVGTLLFLVAGFGWAKPVPVNVYRLQGNWKTSWALVSLAGPASNIALAVIFALLFRLVTPLLLQSDDGGLVSAVFSGFYTAVILNLYLALFNLIPVPPLDGSRILSALLPDQASRIMEQLERYGFMILIVLLVGLPALFGALIAGPAANTARFLMGF